MLDVSSILLRWPWASICFWGRRSGKLIPFTSRIWHCWPLHGIVITCLQTRFDNKSTHHCHSIICRPIQKDTNSTPIPLQSQLQKDRMCNTDVPLWNCQDINAIRGHRKDSSVLKDQKINNYITRIDEEFYLMLPALAKVMGRWCWSIRFIKIRLSVIISW